MNKLKITIIAIMVALTAFLFLLPDQPDAVWLKWLSIALWIVLIIIIARNSDLFERPKVEKEVKPEDVLSPKLLAYLKAENILDRFWVNYLNGEKFRDTWDVKGVIDRIDDGFNWGLTPEGSVFWERYAYDYERLKESRKV